MRERRDIQDGGLTHWSFSVGQRQEISEVVGNVRNQRLKLLCACAGIYAVRSVPVKSELKAVISFFPVTPAHVPMAEWQEPPAVDW